MAQVSVMLTIDKTKGQIYVNRDSENDKITGGRNFMRPSTRGTIGFDVPTFQALKANNPYLRCPICLWRTSFHRILWFASFPVSVKLTVDKTKGQIYVNRDSENDKITGGRNFMRPSTRGTIGFDVPTFQALKANNPYLRCPLCLWRTSFHRILWFASFPGQSDLMCPHFKPSKQIILTFVAPFAFGELPFIGFSE
ncbi:uncharacterized protein LOC104450956 isoform X3 [Eucalyptus grandis]|uniref:uncharacterized protein LOC104450956 isoform X3 n=1 Tax=Eucalyptus grandis TaxID=71139 RepID=UPI00192E91AB|nr:uncharacterized protein LOC104450956 isoform X3 [Eucalyptus grandis]